MRKHTFPALLAAGAVATTPILGTVAAHAEPEHSASAAAVSAPAEERSLSFKLLEQNVVDDSSYGLSEEYRFEVTNTGTVPTGYELHALTSTGENFLDAEGQEMYLACDYLYSGMQPGETNTCRMFVRIGKDAIDAGKTTPQHIHFRGWSDQTELFPGFVTESRPIPADLLPNKPEPAPTTPPDLAPTESAEPSVTAEAQGPSENPANHGLATAEGSSSTDDSKPAVGAGHSEHAGKTLPGDLAHTGINSVALIIGAVTLIALGGSAVAVSFWRRKAGH